MASLGPKKVSVGPCIGHTVDRRNPTPTGWLKFYKSWDKADKASTSAGTWSYGCSLTHHPQVPWASRKTTRDPPKALFGFVEKCVAQMCSSKKKRPGSEMYSSCSFKYIYIFFIES